MTARDYAERVQSRLQAMCAGQIAAIEAAGQAVADAIAGGGRAWVAKTSHGLHDELSNRAGGLMAIHPLDDPIVIQPGDAVLIPTNAGTTVLTVEIANIAHERGATVITLTQLAYEGDPDVLAEHPSGKKLNEVSDIVVDLGGQVGDGELSFESMRILPGSGVAMAMAAWMIVAESVALLTAQGKPPLMWQSMQISGATPGNLARLAKYRRTGVGYSSGSEATA